MDKIKRIVELCDRFTYLIHQKRKHCINGDRKRIKQQFFKFFGYKIDLENPKTLNEKIQWLKLNNRNNLQVICADKYEVRSYVEKKINKEVLIPLYFECDYLYQFSLDKISNFPCIVKTNHDSGTAIKIKNKNDIDVKLLKKKLRRSLKRNYYYSTNEWQYKNIKPKIIVEKLLKDPNQKALKDYKVHCINGKATIISVDSGKSTKNHYRNWYTTDWEKIKMQWWPSRIKVEKFSKINDVKPQKLDLLIKYSEELAKPFCYVRIDWYIVQNNLFFGEITFHHASGHANFYPKELDLKYGQKINLITTKDLLKNLN